MSLQVELAITIDVCKPFVEVHVTYKLEGDGPLALHAYEILDTLVNSIHSKHYPNTTALLRQKFQGPLQWWMQYALDCMKPGLEYFIHKFSSDLVDVVHAFKSARLFFPPKVDEMKPDDAEVNSLKAFPFLDQPARLDALKSELPAYLAQATDVAKAIDPLKWWKDHSTTLPAWAAAAKQVVLIQPSSATAERVFPLLKNSFGECQDSSLQDYIKTSLMLQNNQKV